MVEMGRTNICRSLRRLIACGIHIVLVINPFPCFPGGGSWSHFSQLLIKPTGFKTVDLYVPKSARRTGLGNELQDGSSNS